MPGHGLLRSMAGGIGRSVVLVSVAPRVDAGECQFFERVVSAGGGCIDEERHNFMGFQRAVEGRRLHLPKDGAAVPVRAKRVDEVIKGLRLLDSEAPGATDRECSFGRDFYSILQYSGGRQFDRGLSVVGSVLLGGPEFWQANSQVRGRFLCKLIRDLSVTPSPKLAFRFSGG